MTKRFPKAPRQTVYLSAGLLLLPLAAQAQWNCQAAPSGGWNCKPSTATPAAEPTPAPSTAPAPAPQPVAEAAPLVATPAPAAEPDVPRKPLAQAVAAAPANQDPIWDWVPDAAPGTCCSPDSTCGGAYVEPARDWEDADQSPKQAPVRANAANSQWEGDVVKMDGGVTVTRGQLKLTADRAELERSTNRVRLYGDVVVREPGSKITGSNADMTTDNNLGNVVDARILDYAAGIRVTANKLSRRKADVIELDEATYTRCPPDREDWRLNSKHIRLNRKTGRGEAGSTVVRVADWPVFYTPYLNFPIDDRRQTGFLWPSIGNSSSGLDIAVPYYLNLAPQYDATLTPRFITDRGSMLETELRALNRYSEWVLSGAQLNNDQKTGTDRWFGGIREQGQLTSRFSTAIDYSKVSDNDYFHDFSIASLNVKRQTSLNQQADLRYGYKEWSAGLTVQQYQTLDEFLTEPYRKVPQLTLAKGAAGANFEFDYNVLGEYTKFDHNDSSSSGLNRPIGDRYYAEAGISFPMRWAPGYIAPEIRLRHVSYSLDWPSTVAAGTDSSPSATVPETIIDAGLFFDREMTFSDTQLLQTLEPRLYYLYSPYKDQTDQPNFDTSPLTFDYHQLFQPRRFTGHDRLEDFNQLAMGMTTRFIETDSGRELGSASLGQIIYFSDRRVNTINSQAPDSKTRSSIAGQIAVQPDESLWTTVNALWSPDQNQVEQGNAYIHYQPNERGIYNLGYRYHRANPAVSTLTSGIRQVDASAALPLTDHWRLFLRLNYDLDLQSALEDMAGIEYEDCCWRTRVVYQRAVLGDELNPIGVVETKREHAVVVEFQLKGLGGLGRRVGTLLEESIWGYKERE